MVKKKWFRKAVMRRAPYTLGGWCKRLPAATRRSYALASRPKNWSLKRRRLSAGRALQALANVTKDKRTKELAGLDARYFFGLVK